MMEKGDIISLHNAGVKRLAEYKPSTKTKDLFLLGLPGLLFVFVIFYLPMMGVFLAFKDYNYSMGIFKSPWNGFDNFKFFFSSQDAFRVIKNTILLNFLFIALSLFASLAASIMLYCLTRKAVKFFQTILFFPYFISWVVVGYIAYIFLNPTFGVFNTVLQSFGIDGIAWYADSKPWPVILSIAYVWKNLGYYAIIFYTGLMSIDSSYFEASSIDGATFRQQTFKIAIPLIMPLITILTILSIGRILFSDFGLFYFLPRNSGLLYSTTDVIDTYVYRALKGGDIGMSAAVGLCQSLLGFVLVLATNLIVKKTSPENSIF
jgi:putative aldouronate transport system permease protein